MRKNHRGVTGALAGVGLALLLQGCSGWSYDPPLRGNPNLERFSVPQAQAAAPASPTTFSQALTADYSGFATALRRPQGLGGCRLLRAQGARRRARRRGSAGE